MTRPDELADLKAALTDATPRPDPQRRAANLHHAQDGFALMHGGAEISVAAKGSAIPLRHTPARAPERLARGAREMFDRLTTRGGLVTATAIVATTAGALLVLSPDDRALPPPGRTATDEADATVLFSELRVAPPEAVQLAPRARRAGIEAVANGDVTAYAPPPLVSETAGFRLRIGDAGDHGAPFVTPVPDLDAVAAQPDTEAYPDSAPSNLKVTTEEPVSTFSIDVDTASWGVIRSSLANGSLPPVEAVRIEEMINYFPYDYPGPESEHPFAIELGVMDTPWKAGTQLVRIGIQGRLPAIEDRPPLNLVLLIDTSGSMQEPNKLPLLKQSFRLMLSELRPEDEVAIVTYAGSAGRVLDPTPAADRGTILAALENLSAGGSTNGQGGLEQAYATARQMTAEGEIGRILLATDGDFNVGLSDPRGLTGYIADKRESGAYLSVLGFGRGNLDDATMQALAQNGNGTAAYIDTAQEAQKVLVDQLSGALFPIADDVKIQVEWNPAEIAEYRLIGYETRALRREDFNNDAVDAGELGAGHSVTAIYEITPVGSPARLTDPLRYGAAEPVSLEKGEFGFLRLRYKAPGAEESVLIETPIVGAEPADDEMRFAAAIAGFGELLRGSAHLGDWDYGDAVALAAEARGEDPFGYRSEAVRLMRLANSLSD